jgi:general secretion pathway protein D
MRQSRNSSGVPGLGDIPVVGRLFRSQKDDIQKTEIMLLITPHLVRNMMLPYATASEFLYGSETMPKNPVRAAAISARKVADLRTEIPVVTPATETAAPTGEEISLTWSGPRETRVGEQFRLTLVMMSGSALKSVPLQLAFDPSALEVVSVTEGDFFKRGNSRSNFANHVDAPGGRISVGSSRSDKEGAMGQGELATITFRARVSRPRSEVRVLSVAALSPSGTSANVAVPGPFAVSIMK